MTRHGPHRQQRTLTSMSFLSYSIAPRMIPCGGATSSLSTGQDSILEPLSFPEQPDCGAEAVSPQSPGAELLVCLFCPESVPLQQKDVLLKHLLLEHKLVIADVRLIADLPK